VTRNSERRRPPAVVWLSGAIVAALVLACVALIVLVWQDAGEIERLGAEVQSLRGERQLLEARLAHVQATAEAVAGRLGALEANDPAGQLAALQAEIEEAVDTQPDADWWASLEAIQGTLDRVTARLDALEATQGKPATESLPDQVRLEVPRQTQSHNLSCESSAASMAAQYLGVDLSEAEVLAALPRNDNPHLGFRGNVDGPTGGIEDYGVYAEPILEILQAHGLQARLVEGGLSGVRAAITRGHPVIAWLTYNCLVSTPVTETIAGQAVTLVPNQHAAVVTGYNGEGFWANDPWDGIEDFYTVADLEQAMGYFGDMAIEVAGP
jgi:uncharacterized protein YvpB